jgi:hypothetical protein
MMLVPYRIVVRQIVNLILGNEVENVHTGYQTGCAAQPLTTQFIRLQLRAHQAANLGPADQESAGLDSSV